MHTTDNRRLRFSLHLEEVLNAVMKEMAHYCKRWRLKTCKRQFPSASIHHAKANKQLSMFLNGHRMVHNPKSVYLGVALDNTLTFKEHLTKTSLKVKTRHNLIIKLAGLMWGTNRYNSGLAL